MSTKRVLVAYGTKHGATAGIAEQIAVTLREDGLDAVVLPADDVHDVRAYDAVVLGGSLYAGHWSSKAKHCAERNADSLRHRPVWMFSSGPLPQRGPHRSVLPSRPTTSGERAAIGDVELPRQPGDLLERGRAPGGVRRRRGR